MTITCDHCQRSFQPRDGDSLTLTFGNHPYNRLTGDLMHAPDETIYYFCSQQCYDETVSSGLVPITKDLELFDRTIGILEQQLKAAKHARKTAQRFSAAGGLLDAHKCLTQARVALGQSSQG